ncbi:MAG TPA: hypothetical protein VE981_03030 [Planctomycetota bacterium]|nr:hypothetical protein [Planctomycetota bacterium]
MTHRVTRTAATASCRSNGDLEATGIFGAKLSERLKKRLLFLDVPKRVQLGARIHSPARTRLTDLISGEAARPVIPLIKAGPANPTDQAEAGP